MLRAGVRAHTAGCREHERDDDGDTDAEQREPAEPDSQIRRQDHGNCSSQRTRSREPDRANRPQPPDYAISHKPWLPTPRAG